MATATNGAADASVDASSASASASAAAATTASPAPASPNSQSTNAKRKRDDAEAEAEPGKEDADSKDNEKEMTDAPAQPKSSEPSPKVEAAEAETSDKGDKEDKESTPAPLTTSTAGNRDEKRLIRDYFDVLFSFDKSVPSLLKRTLPAPDADASNNDEPAAKRQRQDSEASTIAAKVESDAYALLDDLVLDVAAIINSELAVLEEKPAKTETEDDAEMETGEKDDKEEKDDDKNTAIAHIAKLRDFAYDLYRRETAYPKSGPLHSKEGVKINTTSSLAVATSDRGLPVLTVLGATPNPRQLFSSLPTYASSSAEADVEDIIRDEEKYDLGENISISRAFAPPPADKTARVLTFGELFTSPRNLPSLQPPKLPKSTTKSTTLSFYHPELTAKSKYRSGSYATQQITTGQWLDYSNATPTSPVRTRQRERAQSLAGRKPSVAELQSSEAETLFRGAFSSFAPSHDDSSAIVPATQMGRMWWQRVGHRVFQRMAEAELYDDDDEDVDEATTPPDATHSGLGAPITLDEEALQRTIAEWDEDLVDPSLEEVMGGSSKSQADKDVDEILQEVSDLIVTLASYQRNRNLTLPTSQDRYSADPVNGDMLRNGTLAQQPSEEETLTYETLKAQLSLIVSSLPPYAVARLNSDKLDELNISTKIEVRSDEYRGILEEDEVVVRARQAAQAGQAVPAPTTAPPPRAPAQRAASSSVAAGQHTFAGTGQFSTPTRASMAAPATNFFPAQTPSRASQSHRSSVSSMPHVRPGGGGAAQSQYRPTNGPNGYQPQPQHMGKPGVPPQPQFRQPSVGYPGTPGQQAHMSPQRMVSQPAYGGQMMQPPPGTPQQFRYPPGTPGYPQQMPPQPGMTPQQMPPQQRRPSQPQPPYPGSPANGGAHLAPPPQQQQQQQPSPQPRFHPSPSPMPMTPGQMSRPPPYNAQQPQQQFVQQPPQQQPQQQQRQFSTGAPTPGGGPFGYHTVMDQPQQQRLMEQARARASAHDKMQPANASANANGQVAGLAGIGLGSGPAVDTSKLAAARANMPGMMGQPQQQHQNQRLSPMPRPSMSPSPVQFAQPQQMPPQQYQQHQPQYQQYQQRPMASPSPVGSMHSAHSAHSMNGGTPQPQQAMAPPPPHQPSVSPAPSGGFPRPA